MEERHMFIKFVVFMLDWNGIVNSMPFWNAIHDTSVSSVGMISCVTYFFVFNNIAYI